MDWPPQPSRREPSAPGAKALTAADLWTKAVDTARAGVRSSVAGITYAQAAERAVEVAGTADLEQIALWWIREKLDAGASVVQLYSSLVYAGPRLPGRILRGLAG